MPLNPLYWCALTHTLLVSEKGMTPILQKSVKKRKESLEMFSWRRRTSSFWSSDETC